MFDSWRRSLAHLYDWFERCHQRSRYFYLWLFLFFYLLNFACFWIALFTLYPEHMVTHEAIEDILISFPVAGMGALFDSLSMFVTLWLIKRALTSQNNAIYVAVLSVDILIAFLAALWVLFAFVTSGWLVAIFLEQNETFTSRTELYEGRFWNAFLNPFSGDNIRNILFGIVMGASALLPTLVHIGMAIKATVGMAIKATVVRQHV